MQNDLLNEYSEIDIKSEEELLRKQFDTNFNDISFVDFQNLDREQQKILFNYLIERVEIDEFSAPGEKDCFLTITIHLRIPGFAPKYSLDSFKGLKSEYYTVDNKKTNRSRNGLKKGGGEGACTVKIPTFFGHSISCEPCTMYSQEILLLIFQRLKIIVTSSLVTSIFSMNA